MEAHDAEGPAIHQRHPHAAGRFQADALVARGLVTDAGELPIAGHPEVHLQNRPVVQMHQLDLGPALHAVDREPLGGARGRLRQVTLLGGMQSFEAGNHASGDRTPQSRGGEFDFGQLGHAAGAAGGRDASGDERRRDRPSPWRTVAAPSQL